MFYNILIDFKLRFAVRKLLKLAKSRGVKLAVVESCTGGQLSALITSVSGASEVFDCGIVTYSNEAKQEFVGVKKETLKKYGAVSSKVAKEMAKGLKVKRELDYVVSITGIAGPKSDVSQKPVGLVFVGYAGRNWVKADQFNFKGSRINVQKKSCLEALRILLNNI